MTSRYNPHLTRVRHGQIGEKEASLHREKRDLRLQVGVHPAAVAVPGVSELAGRDRAVHVKMRVVDPDIPSQHGACDRQNLVGVEWFGKPLVERNAAELVHVPHPGLLYSVTVKAGVHDPTETPSGLRIQGTVNHGVAPRLQMLDMAQQRPVHDPSPDTGSATFSLTSRAYLWP